MSETSNHEATQDQNQNQNTGAIAAPVSIDSGGLAPTDMGGLWRIAKMVALSGLSPKGMKTPENIFVAMSHGLEIGLKPMQSLQKIAVINGRPSVWGDAMMGLVLASGLMEECEEYFEGEHGTDNYTAVCTVKRIGMQPSTTRFSVQDAIRAGLWGKDVWKCYPERMLKMRARAFGLRDRFADVLGGLYMAEELQGESDRVRVVDNTKGDDDLAEALTAGPVGAESERPMELPESRPQPSIIDAVVEEAKKDPVIVEPDLEPDQHQNEIPFDPEEMGRLMDDEMAKK